MYYVGDFKYSEFHNSFILVLFLFSTDPILHFWIYFFLILRTLFLFLYATHEILDVSFLIPVISR